MKIKKIFRILTAVLLVALLSIIFLGCKKEEQTEQHSFTFEVYLADKSLKSSVTIQTTQDTVGKALEEKGLIAGEQGAYGLYVKTVDGITLDYNTDHAYWAFYIGDEYASTGVDSTKIVDGTTYSFRVEAGS